MPVKSQTHTGSVVNVLRGTTLNGIAPYVCLFSVAPANDAAAGTQLSGNGYQRQSITFGALATDTGNIRKISNTSNVSFGPATSAWAQAVAFGIFRCADQRDTSLLGRVHGTQDGRDRRLRAVRAGNARREGGLMAIDTMDKLCWGWIIGSWCLSGRGGTSGLRMSFRRGC